MTPHARVQALLEDLRLTNEAHHRIVSGVRRLALAAADDVTEEVKYGGLLFSRGQPFGGVFAATRHVTVEFSHGAALADPHGLLQGSGKLRRHLRLASVEDIEAQHVADYLRLAARAAG